jgi:hypothetical protein
MADRGLLSDQSSGEWPAPVEDCVGRHAGAQRLLVVQPADVVDRAYRPRAASRCSCCRAQFTDVPFLSRSVSTSDSGKTE